MRFFKPALIVACTALSLFPLAGSIDGNGPPPTDYQSDLSRMRREISDLRGVTPAPSAEAAHATAFASLLYRSASLSGNPADLQVADSATDDAIRRVGSWDDLYLLKATLDFTLHRTTAAKRELEMLRRGGDSVQVMTLRADIDLQEGRYREAKEGYQAAAARGRSWDTLARLAYLEAAMGERAAADDLYQQAQEELSAKEMRAYAWVELQRGHLQLAQGRYDEARGRYTRAARAYSGYWLVDAYIAELLGAEGKFDEAASLYQGVIARAPRPEIRQALGDLYLFMGQPALAKPWHDGALAGYLASVRQGEVQYYHHLATFFADVRQDGAEALTWARRDLDLRDNFATREALAWALYRDGRFADALTAINLALASGVKDAHLFFHAAMIHSAAGRVEEGRQLLQRAAAINPRYQDFHAHR
ncbi:MAG TPA: tetratricopeptide repeat protein [Terriglobales bacterium]|nr:tetratricopeptide repeat protein [Terriglobales bacterium]